MPFQYQNTSDPRAAGSISDLMLRRGEIAAQQANAVANAQARAAEVSGQAWAGAAQNIGQSVSGAIQQATDPRRKLETVQLQEAQQGQTDLKALDAAYQQPGGRDAILNALPGHLRPKVAASFQAADKAAADAQEAQLKAAALQTDYAGVLAVGVREHGYDPSAAQLAISHAKATFGNNPTMLQQLGQMEQAIQANPTPEVVKALVDPMIAQSPKQAELANSKTTADSRALTAMTGAAKFDLEKPKIAAETQVAQQNAAGTQPITPYQQAELGNRSEQLKLEKGRAALEQGKFSLEQAKFNQGQTDKTDLTPEGLDAAAMMFAKTGQLPALGMGDKTTRKAIINRAAALTPGLDLATAKADFTANSASLKNITGTLDTLTSFEKTAGKNLDQFLALADKIPDTGVPWLNTPVRLLNDKMVGSENQAAANAARDVALREIARVTNDPKLSGVLSDSARHEVAGLSGKDATFAQIKAVAKVLKQDMANVHQSLTEQQSAIQGRIKLGSSTPDTKPKSDPLGLFK